MQVNEAKVCGHHRLLTPFFREAHNEVEEQLDVGDERWVNKCTNCRSRSSPCTPPPASLPTDQPYRRPRKRLRISKRFLTHPPATLLSGSDVHCLSCTMTLHGHPASVGATREFVVRTCQLRVDVSTQRSGPMCRGSTCLAHVASRKPHRSECRFCSQVLRSPAPDFDGPRACRCLPSRMTWLVVRGKMCRRQLL